MDLVNFAYILLGLAFVLMLAELFMPTGGICFLLASFCAVAGVTLIFYYGDRTTGFIALFVSFVGIPVLLSAIFYLWPESLWGKRLIPKLEDELTMATLPANAILEKLKGRIGRAVSSLRPAGIVEFDGKRVDCVTEGMMIDPNQWVRCVEVRSGRVVVRLIDKPNLGDLENTNFG